MNDFIKSIENICLGFVNTFQDKLTWEWNDRFEAVLATCKTGDKDDLQLSIKRHLKTVWDNSNTEDAPDIILNIISRFKGLMPGQLLFTSDPEQEILLCCAWWPWGDGETVSICVAPYLLEVSDEDKAELNRKFKDWFKI